MPRPSRPRKAYRPHQRHLVNPIQRAMTGVRLLERSDAVGQIKLATRALAELKLAVNTGQAWRSLADTANMAESLCTLGIGSGTDARRVIHAAQLALHDIAQRMQQATTKALHHHEIEALEWLIRLHDLQLQSCSYSEFERAFVTTKDRLEQARAGNAPADAVVVVGDMA